MNRDRNARPESSAPEPTRSTRPEPERATRSESAVPNSGRDTKFCGVCNQCFSYQMQEDKLFRMCRKCGFQEEEKKGALLMETYIQERTSEAYKVLTNEFTRQDPTLPHVTTIKCPNAECATNQGKVTKDVIYMKYDNVNMKYLYICNVCTEQWRSR